jgi:dynein light chain 1, axonemal
VTGVHCSCQIEKLDDVAGTLEELWISYNQINSLDGVNILTNLSVLYMSNNLIKSWSELDKLVSLQILSEVFVVLRVVYLLQAGLPNLRDVLFVGNPIYDEMSREQARIEVLKRIPQVSKIDGDMVKPAERELANGTAEA